MKISNSNSNYTINIISNDKFSMLDILNLNIIPDLSVLKKTTSQVVMSIVKKGQVVSSRTIIDPDTIDKRFDGLLAELVIDDQLIINIISNLVI